MAKNSKQLLMDFYLALLMIPHTDRFRALNSRLYAEVRDTLAAQLDADKETIQGIFERMAAEEA